MIGRRACVTWWYRYYEGDYMLCADGPKTIPKMMIKVRESESQKKNK